MSTVPGRESNYRQWGKLALWSRTRKGKTIAKVPNAVALL